MSKPLKEIKMNEKYLNIELITYETVINEFYWKLNLSLYSLHKNVRYELQIVSWTLLRKLLNF